MTANAYWSVAGTGLLPHCSGAMDEGVPRIVRLELATVTLLRAIPKSANNNVGRFGFFLLLRRRKLEDLTSRCITFWSCAYWMASAASSTKYARSCKVSGSEL